MKLMTLSFALVGMMSFGTTSFASSDLISSGEQFGKGCYKLPTDEDPVLGNIKPSYGNYPTSAYSLTLNDRFQVALAAHQRSTEINCRTSLMVKLPAGYTLSSLVQDVYAEVDLPGKGSSVTIYNTVKTVGLNYGNAVIREQHMFAMNQPIKARPSFKITYANLGDVYDSRCQRDRQARVTVDTRLVIRHRGRVNGNSWAKIGSMGIRTPQLANYGLIPCQEQQDDNWGWWDDQKLYYD